MGELQTVQTIANLLMSVNCLLFLVVLASGIMCCSIIYNIIDSVYEEDVNFAKNLLLKRWLPFFLVSFVAFQVLPSDERYVTRKIVEHQELLNKLRNGSNYDKTFYCSFMRNTYLLGSVTPSGGRTNESEIYKFCDRIEYD